MPKRKGAKPRRLSAVDRNLIQWNMSDVLCAGNNVDCDKGLGEEDTLESSVLEFPRNKKTKVLESLKESDSKQPVAISPLGAESLLSIPSDAYNVDSFFEAVLTECTFYVKINRRERTTSEGNILLGKIDLPVTASIISGESDIWLYVNTIPDRSVIYFDEGEYKKYYYKIPGEMDNIWSDLSHKCFELEFDYFDLILKTLTVKIFILKSYCNRFDQRNSHLQSVMYYTSGISRPSYSDSFRYENHNVDFLYDEIKIRHSLNNFSEEISHPSLVPKLRPYQAKAVQWMLHREEPAKATDDLHELFDEVQIPLGKTIYYNKFSGHIALEKPVALPLPTGGILADEMGLGKTVEVLALILLKPFVGNIPDYEKEVMPTIEPQQNIHELSPKPNCEKNTEFLLEKDIKVENPHTKNNKFNGTLIEGDSFNTVSCSVKHENNIEVANVGNSVDHSYCSKKDACINSTHLKKSEKLESKKKKQIRKKFVFESDNSESDVSENEFAVKEHSLPILTTRSGRKVKALYYDLNETNEIGETCEATEKSGNRKKTIDKLNDEERNTTKKCNVKTTKKCKRRKKRSGKSNADEETDEEAIRKICDGSSNKVTKPKKKPSARSLIARKYNRAFRAELQKWYQETLNNMSSVKKERSFRMAPQLTVDCICGEEWISREKIQCIVCSKWQHKVCVSYTGGKYFCPLCWQDQDLVISSATLIVSPASICHQWVSEIYRHVSDSDFRVFVYKGVQKDCFMQPTAFSRHHIVITTYETLRKELNFAEVNTSGTPSLRHGKRFMACPSPLPCVHWWRLCLDEAQMVECTSSKVSEMARKLTSVHRWAVTGTPIQKSLQDLLGLLQYLGVDPFNDPKYFQDLLYDPYCYGNSTPLVNLMANLLWRTQKKDVLDELGIPEQHDQLHWLNFSPVEEQFYCTQHEACTEDFSRGLTKFRDFNVSLDSLDRKTVTKILAPLLRLRQACIHPQAVRGEFISLNKGLMTMGELLESMIKKTTTECEEALRVIIASINGMAGIHIINNNISKALESYKEVLDIAARYRTSSLKVDKLQMIHTYYNLSDVLQKYYCDVPEDLKDKDFEKDMSSLEEEYLMKYETLLNSARQTVAQHTASVAELNKVFVIGRHHWWLSVIEQIKEHNLMQELINLVSQEFINEPFWSNRFSTELSIQSKLRSWVKDTDDWRTRVIDEMRVLEEMPQKQLVKEAVDCHLCVDPKKKKLLSNNSIKNKCKLCKYERLLKKYESYLFDVSKKEDSHCLIGEVKVLGQLNQGTWKPNRMERVLKKILIFGRSKKVTKDTLEDGNSHFKWLELLKKEFRNLRVVWRQLRDRISARDELEMAKLRLRLRQDHEPTAVVLNRQHKSALKNLSSFTPDSISTIYILEPFQLEPYEVKLYRDRQSGQSQLDKKMQQLMYLENLRKSDNEKSNSSTCSVCFLEYEGHWGVLSCGHSFCMLCVQRMLTDYKRRGRSNVKCPICRGVTRYTALEFFDSKQKKEEKKKEEEKEEDKVTVTGSYSTKVDAIVKCLLILRKKDPTTKALVFSTWERVLDLLESALYENEIPYVRARSGKKFQNSIQQFRENPNVTALLLPIRWGSKGLNLIEATHVLLTEPILNPADELQALGRVHRIGQTHETFIHRFLVRNTIEERVYHLTRSQDRTWNAKRVTLNQLRELFEEDEDTFLRNSALASFSNTDTHLQTAQHPARPGSSHIALDDTIPLSDNDDASSTDQVQSPGTSSSNSNDISMYNSSHHSNITNQFPSASISQSNPYSAPMYDLSMYN